MGLWDGLQETFSNLWAGIRQAWGGATATPEELENINDYLGEDYNPIDDIANTGEDMAQSGAKYLAQKAVPGWLLIAVVALFALVIFDN